MPQIFKSQTLVAAAVVLATAVVTAAFPLLALASNGNPYGP